MRTQTIKLGVLVLFIAGCGGAFLYPPTRELLSPESIQSAIEAAGPYARIWFVVIYAALIVLTVPGTLVTVIGASLFPLIDAFFLTIVGAMLGAIISFGIGRWLGRDAVESWAASRDERSKIRRVLGSFESHGVMAVAYLRIAYVPFAVLNYIAPLTGIRFRDYVLGTLLGILPGSFIFVFMGNTLSSAWKTGDWLALVSLESAAAIALFGVSLLLPKWLKRFENRSTESKNS